MFWQIARGRDIVPYAKPEQWQPAMTLVRCRLRVLFPHLIQQLFFQGG